MKQLRIIILNVLVLLIFINISNASPQFPHKDVYCFNNCHGERGFFYGGSDECGNCHSFYFNNQNFSTQHEPKTCLGCHNIKNKDSFHILHVSYNVSCSKCHINNKIPENTYSDCLSCHIQGLHTIHQNKQCIICHEGIIPKKIVITNEIVKNVSQEVNKTKLINTYTSIINYKKITIYEILMNLYKAIIGDIYGKNSMDSNVTINGSISSIDRK